mgnify:CR=1 FL=1
MAKITLPTLTPVNHAAANDLLQSASKFQLAGLMAAADAGTGFVEGMQKGNMNALQATMNKAKTVDEFNNPVFQQQLKDQQATFGRFIDQGVVNAAMESRPLTIAEHQTKLQAAAKSEAEWRDTQAYAPIAALRAQGKVNEANALMANTKFNTPNMAIADQAYRMGDVEMANKIASTGLIGAQTEASRYGVEESRATLGARLEDMRSSTAFKISQIEGSNLDNETKRIQIAAAQQELAAYEAESGGGYGGYDSIDSFSRANGSAGISNSINSTVNKIIGVESNGKSNAQNKDSTAGGLGQFIDSTWLGMIRKHRPDLAKMSDRAIIGMKYDPALNRQMTVEFTKENASALAKAQLPTTEGNLYLAHFSGVGTAIKALKTNPNAHVSAVYGKDAIAANPKVLGGNKTIGDVIRWANNHMTSRGNFGQVNKGASRNQLAQARERATGRTGDPFNTNVAKGTGGLVAKATGAPRPSVSAPKANATGYRNGRAMTNRDIMAGLGITEEQFRGLPQDQQRAVIQATIETRKEIDAEIMKLSSTAPSSSDGKIFQGDLNAWRKDILASKSKAIAEKGTDRSFGIFSSKENEELKFAEMKTDAVLDVINRLKSGDVKFKQSIANQVGANTATGRAIMNTDFNKLPPATQEAIVDHMYKTLDNEVVNHMASRKGKNGSWYTRANNQIAGYVKDGVTDIASLTPFWDKAELESDKFKAAAGRSLGSALTSEGNRRKKLQDDVYAKSYAKGQQSIVDLATKSQEARRKKLLGI